MTTSTSTPETDSAPEKVARTFPEILSEKLWAEKTEYEARASVCDPEKAMPHILDCFTVLVARLADALEFSEEETLEIIDQYPYLVTLYKDRVRAEYTVTQTIPKEIVWLFPEATVDGNKLTCDLEEKQGDYVVKLELPSVPLDDDEINLLLSLGKMEYTKPTEGDVFKPRLVSLC